MKKLALNWIISTLGRGGNVVRVKTMISVLICECVFEVKVNSTYDIYKLRKIWSVYFHFVHGCF
jgi:hypothetical protein